MTKTYDNTEKRCRMWPGSAGGYLNINIRRSILLGAVILIMNGCAVGQKYNLMLADPKIPFTARGTIAVAVLDQRPVILEGKEQKIAGLIRGGWGNPFHTYTTSGNPLADDMAETIKRSLEKSGFTVVTIGTTPAADVKPAMELLTKQKKHKSLLLAFKVWLPDLGSGGNLSLDHDLTLYVLGPQGNILAEASDKNHKDVCVIRGFSAITERYEECAVSAFKTIIESLFSRPGVPAALR
jgi:hypothetical protein